MSFEFDIPSHHKSIIKVIGVGGGGGNAVKYMKSIGKLGGQNKIPKISNNRKVADKLNKLNLIMIN